MGTHPIFESDFDCLTDMRILFLGFVVNVSWSLPNVDIFIRTLHPDVKFHQKRLQDAKNDLERQINEFSLSNRVKFHDLTSKKENYYADFLILNALPRLSAKIADSDWACFFEETTRVTLDKWIEHLGDQTSSDPKILGRGLFDQTPAIIHHFYGVGRGPDYKTFAFPDFDAGFCMNGALIEKLKKPENMKKWKESPNFQIDIKHELIKFIYEQLDLKLTVSKHFCGGNWHREQKKCLTRSPKELPDCGTTPNEDVFVAVKTAAKFHDDRLKVVRKTWGPKLDNVVYYSSVKNSKLGTIESPQTEKGHCAKLYFILDDFLKKSEEYKWLFVCDDDTIFSAYRLHRITACYDPTKPVAIGERYGYGLNTDRGYPYLTGGGGMLFSRAAVEAWKRNRCACPADDSPDDMIMGSCMAQYDISMVHLNNFHQAKWEEYSEGYLDNNTPFSFHKHYDNDPIQVYGNWFGLDDQRWWSTKAHDHPDNVQRDEL